jgi:transcriptional regulator with GAF, ATPase, and Fis domain
MEIQPKLLRLVGNANTAPGENVTRQANVRIAATNRDLKQRVADGTFREPLFRLNVISVEMPPLRRVRSDSFAEHYAPFAAQCARKLEGFTNEAVAACAPTPGRETCGRCGTPSAGGDSRQENRIRPQVFRPRCTCKT